MESREAQASDGKGKPSSMQHGHNFDLQRVFIRTPPPLGEAMKVWSIKGRMGVGWVGVVGGSFRVEMAGFSPEEQLEIYVF